MIITCPHCQTKYQVTFEAIGSAGRKVQCAHCNQAWDQRPTMPDAVDDADRLFDAMSEDALDEIIKSEELAVAQEHAAAQPAAPPPVPVPNAAEMQKRQAAFTRRQSAMISRLPLARLRRASRVTGLLILSAMALIGYFGRVQIVERYPDLAGVYETIGLGVNVIGLDFSELSTLKTLSGGNEVLTVSAQIVGLTPQPKPVPPVVISLLDAAGHAVYEWSVAPRVRDLMAGERATFDTRLSLPPSEAVRVRLSFAGGNTGRIEAGAEPATATAPPSPTAALATAAPAQAGHGASEHH